MRLVESLNPTCNLRGRMERSSTIGILLRTIALVQMFRNSIAATTSLSTRLCAYVLLFAIAALCLPAFAQDQSPPPILQWFESSYRTVEERTPDVFLAGYGFVWLPPPFRADQGNLSVGYDVYDRFDLGTPDRPTLYGTEDGLKSLARMLHRADISLHVDF